MKSGLYAIIKSKKIKEIVFCRDEKDVKAGMLPIVNQHDDKPTDAEVMYYSYVGPIYEIQKDKVVERFIKAPLPDAEKKLLDRIDSNIEHQRRRFISLAPGQVLEYTEKLREAAAYLNDPSANVSNFPVLMTAEVGITSDTIEEAATRVMNAYERYKKVLAGIAAIRAQMKMQIKDLSTLDKQIQFLNDIDFKKEVDAYLKKNDLV